MTRNVEMEPMICGECGATLRYRSPSPETPDVPDAAKRYVEPGTPLAWALLMVGAFTVVDASKQPCTMVLGDLNSVADRMNDWLRLHPEVAAQIAPSPETPGLREAVITYLDALKEPAYSWVHESQRARETGTPNREVERMNRVQAALNALRAALAATPEEPKP